MPYSYEPHAFEDYEVGQTFVTPGRTITETDVVNHSMVTGDWTEFHTNEPFATESQFGERIAHGPLTFSLGIGLMLRSGFLERTSAGMVEVTEMSFLNPVFLDDTIHCEFEVLDVHDISRDDIGIIDLAMDVIVDDDESALECILTLMIRRRSDLDWD